MGYYKGGTVTGYDTKDYVMHVILVDLCFNPFAGRYFFNPWRLCKLFSIDQLWIGQLAVSRKMLYVDLSLKKKRQKYSACVLLMRKMLLCLQKSYDRKV